MDSVPLWRGNLIFPENSYYCFGVEVAVNLLDLVRYRFSVACVQDLGSKGVDTQPEPAAVKAIQLID